MRTFPANDNLQWKWSGWDIALGVATGGVYTTIHGIASAGELTALSLKNSKNNEQTKDTSENDTIPTIKGSKNQPLAGKTYPLCIGKTRFSPYYFAPYTLPSGTDGENISYYCTYLLGYNKINVHNIKMGTIDIVNNNTVTNGKLTVNSNQSKYANNITLYLEQNNTNDTTVRDTPVTVDGDSNLVGTYKVNQQDLSVELLNTEGTALKADRVSNYNPYKVDVEIQFNALFKTDDKGKMAETSVGVKVEMSTDGGSTWSAFNTTGFGSYNSSDTATVCKRVYNSSTNITTFTAKKNAQMRFVASRTLSYSEVFDNKGNCKLTDRVVWVRVTRTTVKSTESSVNDSVFLSAIRTWSYDETKSKTAGVLKQEKIQDDVRFANSTRLSMRVTIDNNSTYEDFELNEVNCLIEPFCRTWNGTEWSSTYSVTSNPASVALMLLQHPMLGDKALTGDKENKIDLLKYGELYTLCNEHESYKTINGDRTKIATPYRCSGVLTSPRKLSEIINTILITARSSMVMNGTKYSVNIDCERDTPVHILNNHNILADGRSNQKVFAETIDGLKIRFRNQMNDYAQDELEVLYDGVSASKTNKVLETVNIDYIADPDLVWSYGRYLLAKKKLRPETYTLKLGVDAKVIEIGSMVEIQDDTLSVGLGDGGFITELIKTGNYITGFKTDSEIPLLDMTQDYAVKIVHSDGYSDPVVTVYEINALNLEAGYYNTFTLKNIVLETDSKAPYLDDGCSFGIYGAETQQAICTNKSDNGDGTYSLEFVPYHTGVYTSDQATIPNFDSKVTNQPQNVGKVEIDKEYVQKKDVARFVKSVSSLTPYYAVTDNTTMPDPTMIPSTDPSPLGVNQWTTKREDVYGADGLYSQQHPYVWVGQLKNYSDGTKDTTLDSIAMSHWGDKGDAGNDYILDLTQESLNLFANNDGTCTVQSFSTQIYMTKDTEYVPLTTVTVKLDNVDVTTQCTITAFPENENVLNVEIPTSLLTKDNSEFLFTAYVSVDSVQKIRYTKLSVSKFYGIKILDFQLDYNNIKVDNAGQISPSSITPTKYYQTTSGMFQTEDGYMMMQELPNGSLKTIGYDEAGTTYDSSALYKSYQVPNMIYGYNEDGTVDNGAVCGEIVDGQFVAWVFYKRDKK